MEFWGNLLVSVARGQEQLEDMMRWVHQGSPGADDLTSLFRKAYGLNQFPEAPTGQPEVWKETLDRFHQAYRDYLKLLDVVPRAEYEELWNRQLESFQDSFQEYLKLLDVVPRRDYEKVQEENQALKKQIVEMEKAIKDLRILVAEKMGSGASEAVKGFQELVFSQMDKFQEMMRSFGRLSKDEPEKK